MDNNNNSSALKVVFWAIFLMIFGIIVLCYYPIVKDRIQVAVDSTTLPTTSSTRGTVNKDPTVFSEYEVKNNEVTINKYGEGTIFTSSDNYIVKVLKDDMGYILTTVEQNGVEPKEHYFVGQGWYTMDASPIVEKSENIQVEPQTIEILEEPTVNDYQGNLNIVSP